MKGKFSKLAFATVLVALLAFAASARAATVNSLMILDGETENISSDESVEYLVDAASSGTTGVIDVGDILRGAINMNTLNSSTANVGGSTGNDQWSAVFSIVVTGKHYNGLIAGLPNYTLTFGPDAGFQTWLDSLDVDTSTPGVQKPDGPSLATGTMIRMFTNKTSTVDFDGSTTADVNVATAAMGKFYWDLGFANSSGYTTVDSTGALSATVAEGWVGTGGVTIASASSSSSFGNSNFLLSLLQNSLGPIIKPQAVESPTVYGLDPTKAWTVDYEGSVNVRGAGALATNGFDLTDNAQFEFLALPLPAAVWPGLVMLLGVGAWRRRRRLAA